MKNTMTKTEPAVTHGSGNVFADLGFGGDAAELQVKAELTRQIHNRIKALSLTQTKAATRLGIGQPDVSKLINGRFTGYTVDRLLGLLNTLDMDVDIVVRPKTDTKNHARGVVRVLEPAAT